MREFLRAQEVAHELGVTTGRVYQLIAGGLIPAVRIGRSIFVPRASWDQWVRDQDAHAQRASMTGDAR